jgi:two-component system LytT family response regulator
MLRKVKEKNFHVIFTTAYDQYAITAIKFAAFDYLLKPIDIEELKATIDRIAMLHESMTGPKLDALEINFREKTAFSKLAIPTIEGLLFFDVDRIVHLEAMSNYTVLYFTDGNKLTASKTLKEFEDLLPETRFFRIHHSHIINLDHIRRYIRGDGGQVVMGNGNFVDVSRRKKEEFLKKIGH